MKHLGYARLSRSDQDDTSLSISTQTADLKAHNPSIEVFTDEGVSGENNMMEGRGWLALWERFQQLTAEGEQVQVSVVAFDRLGRRKGMVLNALEEITRRGGSVALIREGRTITDPSDPAQSVELLFKSYSSEQYRVEVKAKTKRALQALKEADIKLGNEPKLTQADVARIHLLHEQALGYTSIGKVMNISAPTVKKVLAGRYLTKEEWHKHNAMARARLRGGY